MKYTTVCVLLMVFCALVLSGCADKKNNASQVPYSTMSSSNDSATADAVLASSNVSMTDTEMLDMDQEMKELEALISEMEKEENITIEEI